jgi:tRNA(Ile)-lysidine synthase
MNAGDEARRDDPLNAIRKFYRKNPPSRLGVAVSGGSDSLALLHLLEQAAIARLSAVTIDHGLRPEAAGEAAHVEHVCAELGVPHAILELDGREGGGNLQDWARRGRYSAIADWAKGQGLDAVALGHTRDDQAETFLMRLSREAGVGGLAAMKDRFTRDGMMFHRPLLAVSRAGLRDWLAGQGADWVEDPSNDDENFDRARARKALFALSPLGVTADALATVAVQLRAADQALARTASDWASLHIKETDGDLVIDRARFLTLPKEIARRILADAVLWISGAEYPPRRDALASLRTAIRGRVNMTLGGCLFLNSSMTCRVTREREAVRDATAGSHELWDGRWRLDGPHQKGLEIRALGEAVGSCPRWRETGVPRQSLLSSPAIWRGDALVAAPVAGLANGWMARADARDTFARFLISR